MESDRKAVAGAPGQSAGATSSLASPGEQSSVAEAAEDWAVETSCYLCYAQCVNFGVHGKGGGRPCAKGVADIIEQRHQRRRAAREAAAGIG